MRTVRVVFAERPLMQRCNSRYLGSQRSKSLFSFHENEKGGNFTLWRERTPNHVCPVVLASFAFSCSQRVAESTAVFIWCCVNVPNWVPYEKSLNVEGLVSYAHVIAYWTALWPVQQLVWDLLDKSTKLVVNLWHQLIKIGTVPKGSMTFITVRWSFDYLYNYFWLTLKKCESM